MRATVERGWLGLMPCPAKVAKLLCFVSLVLLGCPPPAKDAKSASKDKAAREAEQKAAQPAPPFSGGGW